MIGIRLSIVKIAYQLVFVNGLLSIISRTNQVYLSLSRQGCSAGGLCSIQYYCLAAETTMKTTAQEKLFADDLSNQIMINVMDRLDCVIESILKEGAAAVNTIDDLRSNNAFQYGMTAPDRDLIFSIMVSMGNKQTFDFGIYIGLDDGTYFGKKVGSFDYREPGYSGYSIDDIQPDNPNYKYYIACMDIWDGYPLNCTMQENMTYVECINDCEPIPCNTSSTKNDEESNVTFMCRNYVTKEVGANDAATLGYIPNTGYCVNKYNQPEERPGYVVAGYPRSDSCYYWDNETIVNRTLSGNYAQCGSDKPCNTTFKGGFYEYHWDHRVDDSYIETKSTMSPTWTDAYIGYDSSSLSVTYTKPIFSTESLNDSIKTQLLFEGVISQSYKLDAIRTFLVDEYKNTNRRVLVFEEREPNYLIGTSVEEFTYNSINLENVTVSYNSSNWENVTVSGNDTIVSLGKVTNGITKWVLYDNFTEFCPYLNGSNPYEDEITNGYTYFPTYYMMCTCVRVPINEFNDNISYQAFRKYNETNFTMTAKGIYYKENDKAIGTQAYVAYTQLFTKENIRWHVMLITPIDRSTSDALLTGDTMFIGVCILATVGVLTCLFMFICFYRRRTEKAVIQADWRFTCAFIIGCSSINISSYTLLGENTDQLCMLRMWSFNGLFVCALSPLFVKVWRMATLLNASVGFQRKVISNFQAFLYTLPLLIMELILLAIFSLVDPPRQSEELGVGEGLGYQVVSCSLILVGCILAYKTRNLDPRYGEAMQLAFSMYNIAFTGLITILVIFFVQLDQVSKIIVQTVSVLWGSCFCSLAFVLPRLLQVRTDRKRVSAATAATTAHSKTFNGNTGNQISDWNHPNTSSIVSNVDSAAGIKIEAMGVRNDEPDSIQGEHGVDLVETVDDRPVQPNNLEDANNDILGQYAAAKAEIIDGASSSEKYSLLVGALSDTVQESISKSLSKDECNELHLIPTPAAA